MSDSRPIGMLDSGVGGLSVLGEVRRLLPSEAILYLADQGHLPYGPRPRDEVRTFVEGIARYLLKRDCKLLVLACNSASAAALHHLRATFPEIPIVGMEPAIKPAAEHTRTGIIGVITTQVTFQGDLFASVIDRFAQNVRVETQVCPELVMLAEQGAPDTPQARAVVAKCLAPLREAGIDQLVLGCTHFPFLSAQISAFLGPDVTIVDPGPAVARQTRRVLEARGMLHSDPAGRRAPVTYLTTGDPAQFERTLTALTGERSTAYHIRWQGGALYDHDDAHSNAHSDYGSHDYAG